AFRRRAPFRDARLVVAGEGAASGSWRISAVPFFAERDGRFEGYRGAARRPRRDEEAGAPAVEAPTGLFGSSLAPDSLRQLVHELRTPINAIIGFAEMIERQLLGPVSSGYRDWAREIVDEAQRLLVAIEDLDTAARVETDRLTLDPQAVDGEALLRGLHDEYAALAAQRGAAFRIRLERDLPPLAIDPVAADRMFARLLAATIGLAREGETITAELKRDPASPEQLLLAISRPALLADAHERRLLDPGYSPDGAWPEAPALGLGFALRLVRNIARETGGSLDLGAENFILRLPAKAASSLSGEQGG
ncbi:MAG: HAMP domain-containing histidine kinase, partial [Sphingomonadaceae bacterium]|nr:HAMP domain-containing histidine kinase [Sphingomonadaceae bacterium]